MRRRIIVVGATIAMFAAVLGLARMAAQPSYALLYAGLEPGTAGEVVKSLEATGAQYDVRGGAIFVEAARRDELRLTLASQGLPKNSVQGYELLDSLTGFGTTSQMFDAAYWRAKEGELARTIMSSPHIQSARVHLARPNSQGLRSITPGSASIAVTTTDGSLSASHAKALKFLVSSAVSGLSPEDVSVIDGRGGLIGGDDTETSAAGGGSRADMLRKNIERLLEARVGYGNAVVEVTVETVTERESILERVIDPESRVAISSETEETTNNSSDSRDSNVSVASNLPAGDGGASGQSSANGSETRERVNYEVSETTREILRAPGAIRKISVAVLVDGKRALNDQGEEVWEARPDEELSALRELVASAVGYDEARGDTITLKSMEFEPVIDAGSSASPGLLASLNLDLMSIIQLVVLAIVTLILGLFVLRPILMSEREGAEAAPEALPAPNAPDAPMGLPVPGAAAPDFPSLSPAGAPDFGGGDLPG
jgi:flagellar M-ring protein FliF